MSPLVLKKGIREKSPYSPRSLLGNSARWVEVKRDEIEGRSATLSFNHLIQSKETNSYREGERGGGGIIIIIKRRHYPDTWISITTQLKTGPNFQEMG